MNDILHEALKEADASRSQPTFADIDAEFKQWAARFMPGINPNTVSSVLNQMTSGLAVGFMMAGARGHLGAGSIPYQIFTEEEKAAVVRMYDLCQAKLNELRNKKSLFAQLIQTSNALAQ